MLLQNILHFVTRVAALLHSLSESFVPTELSETTFLLPMLLFFVTARLQTLIMQQTMQ